MRELGKTYFWGSTTPADRASALHWFREGMKRGDGEAAYLLSFALLRPEASADETDEGLVALKRAARRHPEAMIRFGKLLYDGGLGIAADPPEAREYFALALQRYPKNGDVLEFLGSAYANGEYGVKNNPQEGVRLLALAWEHGSTIAAQRIEQIYRAGRGVPANPAAADEWKARSEAPHAPARDTSPETQT
jgi:TPR repeat protein